MNSRNWICIVKYLDIEQWKNVEHKHEQLLPLSASKLQQAGWVLLSAFPLWYREDGQKEGPMGCTYNMRTKLH